METPRRSMSPRCYECNERGHLRSDCPKLDKEKKRDAEDPNMVAKGKYRRSEKKNFLVKNAWGMSDADSVFTDEPPSSSDDEMKQGITFVAIKIPEVSSSSSPNSKSVSFSQ